MAKGFHLFPSRTQKLRPSAPMVLGWTRPGRVGRCRNPYKRSSCRNAGAFLLLLFRGFGGKFSENGCFDVALRWMGGEGYHPPSAFGGRSPFLCGGRRGGRLGGWNGWEGRRRGGVLLCCGKGKDYREFFFKKDAFYSSKNTAGKVFLKKNHR